MMNGMPAFIVNGCGFRQWLSTYRHGEVRALHAVECGTDCAGAVVVGKRLFGV